MQHRQNQRQLVLGWILVLALLSLIAPVAWAQNEAKMNEAVQRAYPNAQSHVTGSQDINGVKVYNVAITSPQGQSTAQVTDAGDILISADPAGAKNLPAPVSQLLSALFKKPPQNVQAYHVTRYLIDVRVNNKPLRLVVDPVGQLVEIRDAQQIAEEDNLKFPEAKEDQRRGVQPTAEHHYPNSKLQKVYQYPEAPDFFVAEVMTPDNHHARITMNGASDIVATRLEIDPSQLPRAAVQAVNQIFNTDNVQHAYRFRGEYYRIVEPGNKGGELVMQIKPSGEIIHLENTEAQAVERAVTAGHHQAPGAAKPAPQPK